MTSTRASIGEERCRHCGRSSGASYPGGVLRGGNWRCGGQAGCGRWQFEGRQRIEEDARAREASL